MNGIERTQRIRPSANRRESMTVPMIIEVLNGRIEATAASNIDFIDGGIGYRIEELESQPFTGYQTFQ